MKVKHWTGTWSRSITDLAVVPEETEDQTLCGVLQISLGGGPLRVRLSNVYGHNAVQIGAVQVALAGEDTGIMAGTDRPLLFQGRAVATIPTRGEITSDHVDLNAPAHASLAVSLYFPERTVFLTGNLGGALLYRCSDDAINGADHPFVATEMRELSPGVTLPPTVPFLAGVDVVTPSGSGAVVAFGDSITAAAWPAILA